MHDCLGILCMVFIYINSASASALHVNVTIPLPCLAGTSSQFRRSHRGTVQDTTVAVQQYRRMGWNGMRCSTQPSSLPAVDEVTEALSQAGDAMRCGADRGVEQRKASSLTFWFQWKQMCRGINLDLCSDTRQLDWQTCRRADTDRHPNRQKPKRNTGPSA